MKSALSASLKAEDEAVKSRFERAESLLGDKSMSNSNLAQAPETGGHDNQDRAKKERVIRDSFTLPTVDYELIAALRQRCLNSAVSATKSEIVRAGLHVLSDLSDQELMAAISHLAKVKTGRPAGTI